MIDEYGFDFQDMAPESPQVITAVLPHPLHGRLIERVIPLVRYYFSFKGTPYKLCWRDHGVAYYTPAC
jgi:hypothetical protein